MQIELTNDFSQAFIVKKCTSTTISIEFYFKRIMEITSEIWNIGFFKKKSFIKKNGVSFDLVIRHFDFETMNELNIHKTHIHGKYDNIQNPSIQIVELNNIHPGDQIIISLQIPESNYPIDNIDIIYGINTKTDQYELYKTVSCRKKDKDELKDFKIEVKE